MKMSPVVHFEMPYEEKKRMVKFYENAFGWKPQMLGPEMGNYDIKEHMKIVEKAGGKVIGEPWDIPETGKYVSFFDTEGNRVSMIQPNPMMNKNE